MFPLSGQGILAQSSPLVGEEKGEGDKTKFIYSF